MHRYFGQSRDYYHNGYNASNRLAPFGLEQAASMRYREEATACWSVGARRLSSSLWSQTSLNSSEARAPALTAQALNQFMGDSSENSRR